MVVWTDAGYGGIGTKSQTGIVIAWAGAIVTWLLSFIVVHNIDVINELFRDIRAFDNYTLHNPNTVTETIVSTV